MRQDLRIIQEWVEPHGRILDLACGDGTLLTALRSKKNVSGYGMEISLPDIQLCLQKGLSVIHRDIELGLSIFDDKSFDYVLTTHSIQTLKNPAQLLEEMVRVGVRGIVSFPNMGYWRARAHIALKGKMPVTDSLPHQWFDTPNYHLCTLRDFENLCETLKIKILRRAAVNDNHQRNFPASLAPNLFSETALYEISADEKA
jgi:methionine biosynthesis protein MetW